MDKYSTPFGLIGQFSFCGLPLRLDTYAGCGLSCTYCFARLRGGGALTSKIRKPNFFEVVYSGDTEPLIPVHSSPPVGVFFGVGQSYSF